MRQELISVIVPVYNIEGYLPRCLETIAAQTYQNLEIILVDDGSTDNSGKLCDSFAEKDSRARVVHQKNSGLSAARNTGLEHTTGDYVLFVDGDDYIHVDMISIMYQSVNEKTETDIAICAFEKTDSLNRDIYAAGDNSVQKMSAYNFMKETLYNSSDHTIFQVAWNKLYRKQLIEDVRFRHYPICEDQDFNFRVFPFARNVVFIDCPLYFWVQRGGSITHQPDSIKKSYGYQVVMLYDNYENLPQACERYRCFILSSLYKVMVFWKSSNYKTDQQEQVFTKCHEYEKTTRKDYWKNRNISLYEKTGVTILLHCNRLTRWLRKITRNV